MKKTISLLLALVMCLSLCACGGEGGNETNAPTTEPTETTVPAPLTVTETAHCILDGVYVDNSFEDEDYPSMKMVYVLYTVFTNDTNLRISSKSSDIIFESGNTYSSETYSMAMDDYMTSYYSSDYIEDVYIGTPLKVMSMFLVPQGEFSASEIITIQPYGLPEGEELKVAASDVQFFDSPEALAEAADPEGYAEAVRLREPADDATVTKVRNSINGYYWKFYVNNTYYEIEFYAPNRFEVRVRAYNIANGGTYEVRNGFVVVTYDSNGTSVEIPWYWGEDGTIRLNPTAAFDVYQ